ncbi:MAG TPA: V-type ATPase subunit [Thermoplasmata archaeon]|nr:V-type ATPase subunit [Thermoplasmata archaeon]
MSSSPYASALGRLKAHLPAFLPKESYHRLLAAKDLAEVTKTLEPTPYGPAIVQAATSYGGATLLEIAINRTFVQRNRQAYESASFAGKPIVGSYLRRWDIENISLVLSAKAQGRPVTEAEAFLVSSRDIPAGLFAGVMTLDDFRTLLDQPTLEATVTALVKYGYGSLLLPLLEGYARTHDIFPLVQALERDYYARLLESLRYFQGDEWVVRQFVQGEIDVRNVLLLLKGKDAALSADVVLERWIDGGSLARGVVAELFGGRDVPELVKALEGRFPTLTEGVAEYRERRSLTVFEVALQRERAVREIHRMRSYPLSLAILFTYLLLAELERGDLRRIIYGKLYGLATERVESLLILTRV